MLKKCTDCNYCYQQDEGYSNYTVDGTTLYCLLDLNPGFPDDSFYTECIAVRHAEQCEKYTKGDGLQIDVDFDEYNIRGYTDDQELIDLWENGPAQSYTQVNERENRNA